MKISTVSLEDKKIILDSLGYSLSDEGIVIDTTGDPKICPFTGEELNLHDLAIVPGSTILINANPNAISSYLTYLDSVN